MEELTLAHPDPSRLAAFGCGDLDRGELAEVESHLAVCESCCELVSTLPDDEFVDRLRASQKLPGWATAFWGDASVAATPQPASEATGSEVPSSFVLSDSKRSSKMVATIGTSAPSAPSTRELPLEQELPPELLNHPRYGIVRKLGFGGMGSVYLAQHRVMDRPVALKVIRADLLDNAALVERFRREVKSAAHLPLHPNIVAAYDAEQAGDSHFLVMEFVNGINLGDLVKSRGPLPYEAACDAIKQAAEGLEHAHQRGMVHRDIKPQNLMRTSDGQIKILDFGLARLASEVLPDLAAAAEVSEQQHARSTMPAGGIKLTLTDMVLGSADYIAPEQALDPRSADIRADIYSLGCTLYHLLAGQPPFPEGNLSQKLAAHAERMPEPLSELRPDVPAELVRVVKRMMAKDRSERFQRPAEVAETLARLCHRKAEQQHDHDAPRERHHTALSRVEAKAPPAKPPDVGVSRKGQSLTAARPSSRFGTQSGPPIYRSPTFVAAIVLAAVAGCALVSWYLGRGNSAGGIEGSVTAKSGVSSSEKAAGTTIQSPLMEGAPIKKNTADNG
jgi:serine/threonine protein kinase